MPLIQSPQPAVAARVTPTQAAALVDRHHDTIYDALATGELHGAQRVKGGRWQIRVNCLEAWLDGVPCEHQVPASNVVPFPAQSAASA